MQLFFVCRWVVRLRIFYFLKGGRFLLFSFQGETGILFGKLWSVLRLAGLANVYDYERLYIIFLQQNTESVLVFFCRNEQLLKYLTFLSIRHVVGEHHQ